MLYLWIKALHVVFVIAWFAGLFYLPRLFVYHADATDTVGNERFKLMERKLFGLMNLASAFAGVFGITLLVLTPAWLHERWLHLKLLLVLGLVVYHICCGRLLSRFADGTNTHPARWYRWFNEVPALLLVLIVLLVILKPA